MDRNDLLALLPLLVMAGGAILVMLSIAWRRNHRLVFGLTLGVFASGLASLSWHPAMPRQVTALMIMDIYAQFYIGLLLAAGIAVTLITYPYFERQSGQHEEFYLLLLLATLGSAVLVASNHFASFVLGLEILSVSLYGLIGYRCEQERSIEAAVKYLVLASVSSAFLFFGLALIYADTGTMGLQQMAAVAAGRAGLLVSLGLALAVIGIGFKLAVVPFHMWTPDVYEGAPAPATAFVASISKGGVFALLLRYSEGLGFRGHGSFFVLFMAIAIASMLFGNLLALRQNNVKRILAYSSIANLGYLLVAFLAGGPRAYAAVAYYLVSYIAAILCSFGVIAVLSDEASDLDDIAAYRGLFWQRPWMAAIMTIALLSLASIPLTAGFVGKFYVLAAGVGSALWLLVLVLVAGSGIGLYYYLRIIVAMAQNPSSESPVQLPATPFSGNLALTALAIALVWLGVYPAPFVRLIESAARL